MLSKLFFYGYKDDLQTFNKLSNPSSLHFPKFYQVSSVEYSTTVPRHFVLAQGKIKLLKGKERFYNVCLFFQMRFDFLRLTFENFKIDYTDK
jgi:hypothetical protein